MTAYVQNSEALVGREMADAVNSPELINEHLAINGNVSTTNKPTNCRIIIGVDAGP